MPRVGQPQPSRGDIQHARDRGDEQATADLVDEDPIRPLQGIGRPRRGIERSVDHRASEGHEHPGADPLAGDVGDDDADRPTTALHLEQLEEVAADLAGRLVVARQVVTRHDRSAERHEAALCESRLGQLGRQRAVVGFGQLPEPGGQSVER